MLMGAAHNALWAFNARVSLTCLYVLARGLPRPLCGLVGIARSQEEGHGAPAVWLGTEQNVSVCLILRRGLPSGFLCQGAAFGHERKKQGKGKLFPLSDRACQLMLTME